MILPSLLYTQQMVVVMVLLLLSCCHGAFITVIIVLLSLFTGSRKAWEKELYSTVALGLKTMQFGLCSKTDEETEPRGGRGVDGGPTRRMALRKEAGRIITTVLYICSEFKIPLCIQVLTHRKLDVLVWSSGKI